MAKATACTAEGLSWAVWLQSGDRRPLGGETSQGKVPEGNEHRRIEAEVAVEGFQVGK